MTQFNKKSLALAVSAAVLGIGFSSVVLAATEPFDIYNDANTTSDKADDTYKFASEILIADTNSTPVNYSDAASPTQSDYGLFDLRVPLGFKILAEQAYFIRFDFDGAKLAKDLSAYNIRILPTGVTDNAAPPGYPTENVSNNATAACVHGAIYPADSGYAGVTTDNSPVVPKLRNASAPTTGLGELCDSAEISSGGKAGDTYVVFSLTAPPDGYQPGAVGLGAREADSVVSLLFNMKSIDATGNAFTYTRSEEKPFTLTSKSPMKVKYRVYDKPAQAALGEDGGRLGVERVATLLDFEKPSVEFKVGALHASPTKKIDVANSSTKFDDGSTSVALGQLDFQEVEHSATFNGSYLMSGVLAEDSPVGGTTTDIDALKASGTTKLVVTGDFSAAKSGGKVYLATANNCGTGTAATTVTDTSAEWVIANKPIDANSWVCMDVNGTTEILGGVYTAVISPQSASGYSVDELGPITLGALRRNGTILQTPFFNLMDQYVSRFYLTNTGAVPAKFKISLMSDEDASAPLVPTAMTEGTIPAGGSLLLKATDIAESGQRGAAIFQIDGPAENIEGVFQFRNAASGDFDSYVMVKK